MANPPTKVRPLFPLPSSSSFSSDSSSSVANLFWLSVFAFSSRANVGLKLAQLGTHFDALADKYLAVTDCSLGILHIRRAEKGEGAEIVKFDEDGAKVLPIPQKEVPNSVVAFRRLSIGFVDHSVIAFLRRMRRLIENETKIVMDVQESRKSFWALLAQNIWPLLEEGIGTLDCLSVVRFPPPVSASFAVSFMRRHFASSVLFNCAKLRLIECFGILPQTPPDDRRSATVGQALCAWLHMPRQDGRPKMLKCVMTDEGEIAESVQQLAELFLLSSSPAHFFVRFSALSSASTFSSASSFFADFAPFAVENGKTLERFSARLCRRSFLLLERAPIERDEQKWAEWEREVIGRKRWNSESNVIRLTIGPKDIGSFCDRTLRSRTLKIK